MDGSRSWREEDESLATVMLRPWFVSPARMGWDDDDDGDDWEEDDEDWEDDWDDDLDEDDDDWEDEDEEEEEDWDDED